MQKAPRPAQTLSEVKYFGVDEGLEFIKSGAAAVPYKPRPAPEPRPPAIGGDTEPPLTPHARLAPLASSVPGGGAPKQVRHAGATAPSTANGTMGTSRPHSVEFGSDVYSPAHSTDFESVPGTPYTPFTPFTPSNQSISDVSVPFTPNVPSFPNTPFPITDMEERSTVTAPSIATHKQSTMPASMMATGGTFGKSGNPYMTRNAAGFQRTVAPKLPKSLMLQTGEPNQKRIEVEGTVRRKVRTSSVAQQDKLQQFAIYPAELFLGSVQVGGVYRTSFTLTNVSHDTGRFIVKKNRRSNWTAYYNPGPVAPGISVKIEVEFLATSLGEYYDEIVINTEKETFKVPMRGVVHSQDEMEGRVPSPTVRQISTTHQDDGTATKKNTVGFA